MTIKILFIGYVKNYYPINIQNIILSFVGVLNLYELGRVTEEVKLEFWKTKNKKTISTFTRINQKEVPPLLKILEIEKIEYIPFRLDYVSHLHDEIIYKRVIPSIAWELSRLICDYDKDFEEMLDYFYPDDWRAGLG